jgi:hypothetical protein
MTGSRARSVTLATRRIMAAGLAATALAAGAAGCGSASGGTGTTTAGQTDPLAKLSADEIGSKAIANLSKAASVHVAGVVSDSGDRIGLNLHLQGSHGCVGSMGLGSKGSVRLILIGKKVWLKPDQKFWHAVGGTSASVLKIFKGKYLKTTLSSGLGGLAKLCHPSELASAFQIDNSAGLAKGPTSTINGQNAIKLSETGDSAAAYVSVASSPQLLRLVSPGKNGGKLDFTGYGAPVTLRPPPAAQTLDGKKYGF